jgi:hypothetical protein
MPRDSAVGRRRRRAAALVALILVLAAPRWAGAQGQLLSAFRAAPLPSASAGFIYRYDPKTWAFTRESEVAGQIYMERPATIGDGRWNLALSYQWVDLHFGDGDSSARVQLHEFFGGVTYGVTDDLDLGLTVPLIHESVTFRLFGDDLDSSTTTVDPIFIRAKYRALDRSQLQLSIGIIVQTLTQGLFDDGVELPNGDRLRPERVQPGFHLYASRERLPVGMGTFLKPYVNAGIEWFEDDVDHPRIKWSAGIDWNVTSHVTPALAFLATHHPNTPLQDEYNVSVGARISLWRETLVGFANVLVPLDDLRDARLGPFEELNIVPLVGIEATL